MNQGVINDPIEREREKYIKQNLKPRKVDYLGALLEFFFFPYYIS